MEGVDPSSEDPPVRIRRAVISLAVFAVFAVVMLGFVAWLAFGPELVGKPAHAIVAPSEPPGQSSQTQT